MKLVRKGLITFFHLYNRYSLEKAFTPLLNFTSDTIGIGIRGYGHSDGVHVGLLYTDVEGTNRFLHLKGHCNLKNDNIADMPSANSYKWVKVNIDPFLVDFVAQWCETVAKRNVSCIPYAFLYGSTTFGKDGLVHFGEKEHGLTCATFILSVLKKQNIDLIKLDDWPLRPEDKKSHDELFIRLYASKYEHDIPITNEHLKNVKDEVGCVRYRSEEVAGAAYLGSYPSGFEEVEPAGREVLTILQT